MPSLPINALCVDLDKKGERLIRDAFRRNGHLRATKPYRRINGCSGEDEYKACANYIWHMLCFDYCAFHPHHCIPVTAVFDIKTIYYHRYDMSEYNERRRVRRIITNGLDALIKRTEANLPVALPGCSE